MRLSKEAIEEFKDTYYKEFGERISDKEAHELGANLLSLFKIIYRPIPEAEEQKQRQGDNKPPEPT